MSTLISDCESPPRLRVRVWFDDHVIGECIAELALAQRYAAAITSRFPALLVTIDAITAAPSNPQGSRP